jgi:transposase
LIRQKEGKQKDPTMGMIDSKSVKNTDTAEEKGYDAGKKVSGIKLHIVVDTLGLPLAMYITTANVTDRNGAIKMISCNLKNLFSIKKYLVDGGYSGENFANEVNALQPAEVEVVKRNELHKFVVLPKRWVVERSLAWPEKHRRLWKNCERKIANSLQFTVLAYISTLIRRF